MADLLTHVLVAYVVLTVVGHWIEWLTPRWVSVGMCGAAIPDLRRIELVLDDRVIRETFGVPFAWEPLGTLWGVIIVAGAVAVLFGERRRRVYLTLLVGAGSHLALDGLRIFADGRADFWLYPLWWRPPTPGLYVSADWRVSALAVAIAVTVSRVAARDRHPTSGRDEQS